MDGAGGGGEEVGATRRFVPTLRISLQHRFKLDPADQPRGATWAAAMRRLRLAKSMCAKPLLLPPSAPFMTTPDPSPLTQPTFSLPNMPFDNVQHPKALALAKKKTKQGAEVAHRKPKS